MSTTIIMEELSKLNNVFMAHQEARCESQKITAANVENMTIVYNTNGFNVQKLDESKKNPELIFYVQKYNRVFLFEELYQLILNHPEENFLICNEDNVAETIYACVDSKANVLKVDFFVDGITTGRMKKIVSVQNIEGTAEWDKLIIHDTEIVKSATNERYYYTGNTQITIELTDQRFGKKANEFRYRKKVAAYDIFNEPIYGVGSEEILKKYLILPNQTRITSSNDSSSISFSIGVGADATESITKRYGIRRSESYWRSSDTVDESDIFPRDSELDDETWARIKTYITSVLNENRGRKETSGYSRVVDFSTKAVLVITKPVTGHRRPTYHYIKGFKNSDAIDIVELAKGELQTIDMIPVNCYYLHKDTGEYVHISRTLFGHVKSQIIETAEVDKLTLQQWTDEKSLNPNLLNAVSEYTTKHPDTELKLEKVKLFNRLPFGALFSEQLIKSDELSLAINFAEYIVEHADNMNYNCGSLKDILTDCNPEGTSLIKILNMTKPCYDLLFKTAGKNVANFAMTYNTIKHFAPDGVLTKEAQKFITQYIELNNMGWTQYHCGTGRNVDIIGFSQEIKIIYKMINKIKLLFANHNDYYDALRHYREIVSAYFQFLDYGWSPADSQIFIEFGLNGPIEKAIVELTQREHAANTSLETYKDKINETARLRGEKKLETRKRAINKLLSTETMVKEKNSLFKKYTIIAPSQIYGVETEGSLENEGAQMRHCVFRSYAGSVIAGKYTVLYLRLKNSPETSLVTIGITAEGRINQTYTFDNNNINEEQALAIVEWANHKKGLVTFKSEHHNVMPGGWCNKIDIPDLPIPSKEWLMQLGNAEIEDDMSTEI